MDALNGDVREVVDRLPDTDRGVAILSFFFGQSHESIASLLQLTPNTVKMRLHRARSRLRKMLRKHVRG